LTTDIKRNLANYNMNDGTLLYISSNNLVAEPRDEFSSLANVISWRDLSGKLIEKFMGFTYLGGVEGTETRIDPIVTAMIDAGLAGRARIYLGIRYSDFSRMIVEIRARQGKRSEWYQ
jgi:hypothetical protein